jgi:hypothetical protein
MTSTAEGLACDALQPRCAIVVGYRDASAPEAEPVSDAATGDSTLLELERAGYLTGRTPAGDRRASALFLTPSGAVNPRLNQRVSFPFQPG